MDGLVAEDLVINGAYLVSVLALAVRDLLRLRLLLLGAQGLFLWWGVLLDHQPTVLWNLLFIVINSVMILRILWERRPLTIPEEFRDLYEAVFTGMSPRDFLLFLELGNPHYMAAGTLVEAGKQPDSLKLILDGSAGVYRDGEHLAELNRGQFVAEMSLLTGRPASADVRTDTGVGFVSWSRRKLETLEALNPVVYLELQKALGRDVSGKATAQPPGATAA